MIYDALLGILNNTDVIQLAEWQIYGPLLLIHPVDRCLMRMLLSILCV